VKTKICTTRQQTSLFFKQHFTAAGTNLNCGPQKVVITHKVLLRNKSLIIVKEFMALDNDFSFVAQGRKEWVGDVGSQINF